MISIGFCFAIGSLAQAREADPCQQALECCRAAAMALGHTCKPEQEQLDSPQHCQQHLAGQQVLFTRLGQTLPPACAPAAKSTANETQDSCSQTADSFAKLHMAEHKAMGHPVTQDQLKRKIEAFLERCRTDLATGKLNEDKLVCVRRAPTIAKAKECLH
jgi:hypothetical protein